MRIKELKEFLEREIPKLPTFDLENYIKVFDAETVEEGVNECFHIGRREGYETVYFFITGKEYKEKEDKNENHN